MISVNKILRHELFKVFIKFCIVGGIATVFNYALFFFLFQNGLHYLVASGSGYILGVFIGFLLNKYFTFQSKSTKYHVELSKYFLVYAISLILGLGLLKMLVFIGIPVLIANVFTIGLTTITNFLGSRFFVFR